MAWWGWLVECPASETYNVSFVTNTSEIDTSQHLYQGTSKQHPNCIHHANPNVYCVTWPKFTSNPFIVTLHCVVPENIHTPPRMVLPIIPPHPLRISVPEGSCITPPPPRNFLFSFSWPYIAACRDFRPLTA